MPQGLRMGGHRQPGESTGFASVLRRLRDAAGLSQHQLADKAGMNIGGITKLEQGQREPSWATVLTLAAALGVTPNDFIPKEVESAEAEPERPSSKRK